MAKVNKVRLPKGYKLILTTDVFSSGRYYEESNTGTTSSSLIAINSTVIIDEYYSDRDFVLVSDLGQIQYEIRLDLDDQDSTEVPYDNTTSGLSSTTLQGAIDELAALPGTDDQTAAEVPYDNSTSGLAATELQSAVDEIDGRVDALESAPAPTASLEVSISQVGHGLSVGDPIRLSGSTYVLGNHLTEQAAEIIGVVTTVTDIDNFKHAPMIGRITGLSGLTAGEVYWLGAAGELTTTQPTAAGTIRKAILVADSTTSGYLKDHPGIIND